MAHGRQRRRHRRASATAQVWQHQGPVADLAGGDDSGEALRAATGGEAGAGRLEAMSFEADDAPRALASAGAISIATSEHDAILECQRVCVQKLRPHKVVNP